MPKTLEQRLAKWFIKTPGGCWYWTGRVDRDGYGRIEYQYQDQPAYRVMMIAEGHDVVGLEVDHLCRRRRCVNPLHLEVVTKAENNRRRDLYGVRGRSRMFCGNGHKYTDENTYFTPSGRRQCRPCGRASANRYAARKRAA